MIIRDRYPVIMFAHVVTAITTDHGLTTERKVLNPFRQREMITGIA